MQFLAGIIDTDGNYDARKHNFEIIQKFESVTAGIVYIARSLGIKTTVKTKVVNGCTYYRIFLLSKGWIIPTKVKRKQCPEYTALQKILLNVDLILNLLVKMNIMVLKLMVIVYVF